MNLTNIKPCKEAPKGLLQINDAKIIFRNFEGCEGDYNRAGDRNFAVVIDDLAVADELIADGWNVKIRPPKDEDGEPFAYLKVKVAFNEYGPHVYLISGGSRRRLEADTVGCIDRMDILSVDMDIRPYDWEINGKSGRTAYLQGMEVIQRLDRFTARYEEAAHNIPEENDIF